MKRAVLCVLASAACSTSPHYAGFTDGGSSGIVYDFDSGATSSASGRGSSQDADAPPPPPAGHVRFANWVPDGPGGGYSFCLSPQGSSASLAPFQPKGLVFPGTSAYAAVPPGTYDAQLVAAGGDCSSGILSMSTTLPALADGSYVTVAVMGEVTPTFVDPSLEMLVFVDDPVGMSGVASVRVIDAAPSLQYVSIGTGSRKTNDFKLIYATAEFGKAATVLAAGQMVDANGYAALMPLSNVELSVQPITKGGTDVATASNVSLGGGAVATLAVVGGKTGGPAPQIMLCDDAAAAGGAAYACKLFTR